MKQKLQVIAVGVVTATLAISNLTSIAAAAHARHKGHHLHRSLAVDRRGTARRGTGVESAAENGDPGKGLYAGAGGIFSPNYEVPDPGTVQIGAQLLGGDFGKAYQDYYKHYYYYKYAYCPLGTEYVIYLRRCVGPFSLFQ